MLGHALVVLRLVVGVPLDYVSAYVLCLILVRLDYGC